MGKIKNEVFTEYEIVRRSGVCNMFDMNCVKRVADDLGLDSLKEYCENTNKYGLILQNYRKAVEKGIISES